MLSRIAGSQSPIYTKLKSCFNGSHAAESESGIDAKAIADTANKSKYTLGELRQTRDADQKLVEREAPRVRVKYETERFPYLDKLAKHEARENLYDEAKLAHAAATRSGDPAAVRDAEKHMRKTGKAVGKKPAPPPINVSPELAAAQKRNFYRLIAADAVRSNDSSDSLVSIVAGLDDHRGAATASHSPASSSDKHASSSSLDSQAASANAGMHPPAAGTGLYPHSLSTGAH